MTQSSSVLLPFDSFMAIDRSYATCYRSERVRNAIRKTVTYNYSKMKQNRTVGRRDGKRDFRIARSAA